MTERFLNQNRIFFRRLAALTLALSLLFPAALAQEEAPQALYRAVAQFAVTIREEPSRDSEAVGAYQKGERVLITGVDLEWLSVVKGDTTGYILRHAVEDHTTLVDGILPFGAIPSEYVARLGAEAMLRSAPSEDAKALAVLPAGTRIALAEVRDGWGKVVYWRQYGYVRLDECVVSMEPVYAPEDAMPGDIIAAYCSYYALSGNLVPSRIINIKQGCRHISIAVQPGERFSFNEIAGPYGPSMGYEKAMSFFEGEAVPSYGGGTCQVSSTLYNALLPLTGRGIDILYRRAHGPSGATYLPHGVDAAVGSDVLDLVFRNRFDFPIRIDAFSAGEGVVYVAIHRAS